MASSIACSTTDLSMDLSRATASAICSNSVRLAAMAAISTFSCSRVRLACFQIFLNQLLGQNEFCFGDAAKRKSAARSVHFHDHIVAVEPEKQASETLPALGIWCDKLDLRIVTCPPGKIG